MRIIDTHAHYDDEAFDEDRETFLPEIHASGVETIVNVGASMEGSEKSVELAEKWPFIYAAVGIHPDDVGCLERPAGKTCGFSEDPFVYLRTLAGHPKCVAIGEIGLDYHWMKEEKEIQKKWFIRQLELANELDLPVNIHSRDAAQDTFDIMKAYYRGEIGGYAGNTRGGIIHCYSGSPEMAAEYVKMGYCLGIGGVVCFKNGRVLKEVVRQTPLENLVTETDSPYLAPPPNRGKRNNSANIAYVIDEIARIKEIPAEEAAQILAENARRIYRLDRK